MAMSRGFVPTVATILVGVWGHRADVPAQVLTAAGLNGGFQYIEALVSSGITGGCGGGNFCPDAAVTRRQMAIFLAKELGLHWPD